MSATDLTPRERTVLDLVRAQLEAKGYPPSVRDVAAAAGLASPSSAAYVLNALEVKGWIRRDPGVPRSLRILDPDGAVS